MPENEDYDVRSELFEALMEKVRADRYPSTTMLDMIESVLTPEELPEYVEELMGRIRADEFPSMDMLRRVHGLT